MSETTDYQFPASLVGRADLARLLREIETVDGDLESQKVRATGNGSKPAYHMPLLSQALSDFLNMNKLDITKEQERMVIKERVRVLKDKAPTVHMTFAVEADPESLQTLVAWLRANAHPHTLLSVGLQPNLVGGVYLRTPNHVHDYSMRALFANSRDVLAKEIEGMTG